MSRINELIAEHCPNGVQFRELGELGVRNKGTSITAGRMKTIHMKGGPIRVFAGGQTIADVAEGVVPAKDVIRVPSIIVKSRGYIGFSYYDRPFTHKAELWSYSIIRKDVDQKFIFYYLLTQIENLQEIAQATSVKMPQLCVKDTDTFPIPIPIPPLEVQREIVKVLDTFTKLEAELEARRRQYQYYRDALLTLGERTDTEASKQARITTVGELYESSSGLSKSADQFGFGQPFLSFKTVFNNPVVPAELSDLVNTTETEQARYSIKKGDVFVTRTSEDLDGLGMSCAALRDYPKATFNGFTKRLRPKENGIVDPQFAAYFFRSSLFRTQIAQMAVLSTRVSLNDDILLRIHIPIPPIEEQERIVAILDKFDALVNDITSGLPAEIKARRQQYAHYRDRLLTFKEAA